MIGAELKIEILRELVIIDPDNEGVYIWALEEAFPSRRVKTSMKRLVRIGLVREIREAHGTSSWTKYQRTGKQLGPQQKLEVFVGVEA